ncbi:MAG TPA: hypothetical protein VGS27_04745, partial [Candidatus Sulfotelmatobacter sp.]|nr:hypothetical protein [Candidatus Sulfotelmatobacter sp.]
FHSERSEISGSRSTGICRRREGRVRALAMKDQEQIAIVARLRSFHSENGEERLVDALRLWIEDPTKPKTDKGTLRINPILVLLAAMAVVAGGTFLFFSLVQL